MKDKTEITVAADANDVIDTLSAQISALNKQNAILTSQLSAAMKLIPADVLKAMMNEEH